MIQDELEYNVTKSWVIRAEEALVEARDPNVKDDPDVHPLMRQYEIAALEGVRRDLLRQLAEYENLRNGQPKIIQVTSLAELPAVLLKARIAAGLSQKELAEKLGLAESEVKSFEDSNYGHASLACLRKVSEVLQIKFSGNAEFPSLLEQPNATPEPAKPVTVG